MKQYILSIIICTRNVEDRLSRTLESLLAQSFQDFEIVLIDAASTDGTLDKVREYEKKFDGRLRWISEPDSGIYEGMNKGVCLARGEFIHILGAGDWLEPGALGAVATAIETTPEAEAIYGVTRVWNAERTESRLVQTLPDALPVQPMQHPALFYRKSLHDKFGLYDEKYRIVSDYDFCLKAFYAGKAKLKVISVVTSNFVMDGISSTREALCERENDAVRRALGLPVKSFAEKMKFRIKKMLGV